jgi:hypothetical protein
MLYFESLPSIEYNFTDVNQTIKMKNIFYQLQLDIDLRTFTRFYRIDGFKRIDTISFELYNSTEYWWIIALLNNINDIIFDLPVDDNMLRQIAMNLTLEKYDDIEEVEALNYYLSVFDNEQLKNDDKRLISVVNTEHMGQVISEILKRL